MGYGLGDGTSMGEIILFDEPRKKCVNHGIWFGKWNKYGCDHIVQCPMVYHGMERGVLINI